MEAHVIAAASVNVGLGLVTDRLDPMAPLPARVRS
jgi:hypothetical protein